MDNSAQQSTLTSEEIRDAFTEGISLISTPAGYWTGLVTVAASLILLQASYLALIAAAIIGVVYYILVVFPNILFLVIRNIALLVFALSPPVAGCVVVFFLLKPLLAKRPAQPKPVEVRREAEPRLFEFIDALCNTLGAPRPARIRVDLEVNAAASLGDSWKAIFRRQPELVVGLPLAGGLSLPQFTGVLTHEFGHFRQKAGMRLQFIIRNIQHWFARVAYERDEWDVKLDEWQKYSGNYGQIFSGIAAASVAASRAVLRGLCYLANIVSCSFSHHMEYDADLHEAAVVGAAVTEATLFEIRNIAAAANHSWKQIEEDWKGRQLIASFPEMVGLVRAGLSEDALLTLRKAELERPSARFSTHPSTPDRLSRIRKSASPGIFHLSGSALRLFCDFPALAREATTRHYGLMLGKSLDKATMREASEVGEQLDREQGYATAIVEVFGESEAPWQWLALPEEPGQTMEASACQTDANDLLKKLRVLLLREAASIFVRMRVSVNPSSFAVSSSEADVVERERLAARTEYQNALHAVGAGAASLANRISSGVARANQANVHGTDWDGATIWKAFRALAAEREELLELRIALTTRQLVTQNLQLLPAAQCANTLDALTRRAVRAVETVRGRLGAIESQLSVHGRTGSVAAVLTPPIEDELERAAGFLNVSDSVASQLLGRLCHLALEGERITVSTGLTTDLAKKMVV